MQNNGVSGGRRGEGGRGGRREEGTENKKMEEKRGIEEENGEAW